MHPSVDTRCNADEFSEKTTIRVQREKASLTAGSCFFVGVAADYKEKGYRLEKVPYSNRERVSQGTGNPSAHLER